MAAPSRGTSPTPVTSSGWMHGSDPGDYAPDPLPEQLASAAISAGFKAGVRAAVAFSRVRHFFSRRLARLIPVQKYVNVGWMEERREETLLEVTRLDAIPAEDQACTMCRMAGKRGEVLAVEQPR